VYSNHFNPSTVLEETLNKNILSVGVIYPNPAENMVNLKVFSNELVPSDLPAQSWKIFSKIRLDSIIRIFCSFCGVTSARHHFSPIH
jgi:hypothetical protein